MAPSRARTFFDRYTQDLTPQDFQRMFTRDTPEAYRYFTRHLDVEKLAAEPWYRRWAIHARLIFTEFTMRLSPARRVLYAFSVAALAVGMLQLFRGFAPVKVLLFPFSLYVLSPVWVEGTMWLFLSVARGQPADPDGGRRSAVAQGRPRDRARYPARDAAERIAPGRRRRRLRRDASGEHGRRRLLRHPRSPGWPHS